MHPDIFLGVSSFLFCSGAKLTIKKEKEKERKEPKERIIKRIETSIYFLFLFIIYIFIYYILGGVERGESTGAGKHNRSI